MGKKIRNLRNIILAKKKKKIHQFSQKHNRENNLDQNEEGIDHCPAKHSQIRKTWRNVDVAQNISHHLKNPFLFFFTEQIYDSQRMNLLFFPESKITFN